MSSLDNKDEGGVVNAVTIEIGGMTVDAFGTVIVKSMSLCNVTVHGSFGHHCWS